MGVSVSVFVGRKVTVEVGVDVKVAVIVGEEVAVGEMEGVGLSTRASAQVLLSVQAGRSQVQLTIPSNTISSMAAAAPAINLTDLAVRLGRV